MMFKILIKNNGKNHNKINYKILKIQWSCKKKNRTKSRKTHLNNKILHNKN